MNFLISSHLPLKLGGYANQLNELIRKLVEYNISVGVVCWHCEDIPEKDKSVDIQFFKENYLIFNQVIENDPERYNFYKNVKFYLPGPIENFWEKIEKYTEDFCADKILFYQDMHVLEYYNIKYLKQDMYLWINIHNDFKHTKNEDKVLSFLPLFKKIVTSSNFGIKVLRNYNYDPIMIRHTISEKFKNTHNKKILKKNNNLSENTFVCLMVAKNSGRNDRKAFIINIQAFKILTQNRENCKLILKYGPYDKEYVKEIVDKLDLNEHVIKLEGKYMTTEELCSLYNMSDVLLSASCSEGFGVPIVEAQFCGTPVITTNCTAMKDNTFNGICTEPAEVSVKVNGINGWSNPKLENVADALETIYQNKHVKNEINRNNYNINFLFNKWKNIFEI